MGFRHKLLAVAFDLSTKLLGLLTSLLDRRENQTRGPIEDPSDGIPQFQNRLNMLIDRRRIVDRVAMLLC